MRGEIMIDVLDVLIYMVNRLSLKCTKGDLSSKADWPLRIN